MRVLTITHKTDSTEFESHTMQLSWFQDLPWISDPARHVQISGRFPSFPFSDDLQREKPWERSLLVHSTEQTFSLQGTFRASNTIIICLFFAWSHRWRKHPGITFCIGNRSYYARLLFPFRPAQSKITCLETMSVSVQYTMPDIFFCFMG